MSVISNQHGWSQFWFSKSINFFTNYDHNQNKLIYTETSCKNVNNIKYFLISRNHLPDYMFRLL